MRAVQYTQYPHAINLDSVRNDEGRKLDYQLSSAFNSTLSAAFWELNQHFDLRLDAIINQHRVLRALCFDVIKDRFTIRHRKG
nr:hypothetical protein [Candidatus Koribacter versatilis]